MKIGILALQGAFREHQCVLDKLGVTTYEIRQRSDFTPDLQALILPGGESTVMGKLLTELNLLAPVRNAIQNGMPVFGTCAGMILLAKQVDTETNAHLGVMDIVVSRNAYGRQNDSFITTAKFDELGIIEMPFIRAPIVISASPDVVILASIQGQAVAVRQNHILATAFHPELTSNLCIHQYFLKMIHSAKIKVM